MKTFCVMHDHTLSLHANHQSRRQATSKWTVNLVIADGHFKLPHGLSEYVWDNTSLYHPWGYQISVRRQLKKTIDLLQFDTVAHWLTSLLTFNCYLKDCQKGLTLHWLITHSLTSDWIICNTENVTLQYTIRYNMAGVLCDLVFLKDYDLFPTVINGCCFCEVHFQTIVFFHPKSNMQRCPVLT